MSGHLLAIPNVSEGRDQTVIDPIAAAFGPGLLDVHSDPDHHRSVFTLAGDPGWLAEAVLRGAAEAVARIDLRSHRGIHPRVGVVDVAPIVYPTLDGRGAACAEALLLGDLLTRQLGLPVFLYGELGQGRTRASLRRGGPEELERRVAAGELAPDFGGARRLHPGAGAVLVAARPPLIAFNLDLASPAGLAEAQAAAAAVREGGADGLPGVRALGLWLEHRNRAQVSVNVEDHRSVRLAEVVAAVGRHAAIAEAEVIGLPPAAALDGFPAELPLRSSGTLEDALARRR